MLNNKQAQQANNAQANNTQQQAQQKYKPLLKLLINCHRIFISTRKSSKHHNKANSY